METAIPVELDYEATIGEICNTNTFFASNTDLATGIIRSELHSSLGSMIEQAHITSESRYEAINKKIDALIEQISAGFGQATSWNNSISSSPDSQSGKRHRNVCYEQQSLEQTGLGHNLNELGVHTTMPKYRRTWYKNWTVGNISIRITRTTRRHDDNIIAKSDLTISVRFWPNQKFHTTTQRCTAV